MTSKTHRRWKVDVGLYIYKHIRIFNTLGFFDEDSLGETCQKEKIVKTSFKPKNIVSISRLLELLNIELFRCVCSASVEGKKYGLVIVDEFSR